MSPGGTSGNPRAARPAALPSLRQTVSAPKSRGGCGAFFGTALSDPCSARRSAWQGGGDAAGRSATASTCTAGGAGGGRVHGGFHRHPDLSSARSRRAARRRHDPGDALRAEAGAAPRRAAGHLSGLLGRRVGHHSGADRRVLGAGPVLAGRHPVRRDLSDPCRLVRRVSAEGYPGGGRVSFSRHLGRPDRQRDVGARQRAVPVLAAARGRRAADPPDRGRRSAF